MNENNSNKNTNKTLIIIMIIIGILILIPCLKSLINSTNNLNSLKLENKLLSEGKVMSLTDLNNEIAEAIKNKNYSNITTHLSKNDYTLQNSEGKKYTVDQCLSVISEVTSYSIEKRANDVKDEETYRIYINGNSSSNSDNIITIVYEKNVTKNEIQYNIKTLMVN